MKVSLITLCTLTLVTTSAFGMEWDAKTMEAAAGAGYGKVNTEGYSNSFSFSLSGGMTVPVFVEQHTRLAALITTEFSPANSDSIIDAYAGNFLSFGISALIEHDLNIGKKQLWYGVGVMASGSFVAGQYQWQTANDAGALAAVTVKDEFTPSASIIGRLEYPISNQISVGLKTQYSPLEGAYNGTFGQVIFHF